MLCNPGHELFFERALGDDTSTEFQRIDGDARSATICFLPWLMPYKLAKVMRIVPREFLACYEMPRAIVSSEPELCVEAVEAVVADAARLVSRVGLDRSRVQVVGLSIGNATATVLANRLGARLCSIASADRGDLTLWESPASRQVRERAERKGYRLEDFTAALRGLHTIENLGNLAPASTFVVSLDDELIPAARREGLVSAVRRTLPAADVSYVASGHFGTMIETVRRGVVNDWQATPARA
jgi:pimeloyl-ACP methyl ester carboxylesterase